MTLKDLDALVKQMRDEYEKYSECRAQAAIHDRVCKRLKIEILDVLNENGKSKYHVDGLGMVSVKNNYKVTVPKNPEDKLKMLEYFKNFGENIYADNVSVNYQRLNSWYNAEVEEQGPDFQIPGVGAPVIEQSISFRSSK
tara:strand:- start:159 stop:578 length:420 start_codon:yes stop_codon:yes gene_type:complete